MSDYYKDALKDVKADFLQQKPQSIHGIDNYASVMYYNQLMRKIRSIIEIKNVPDTWDTSALKRDLFEYGYFCVYDFAAYGILPVQCTLFGDGYNHRPTNVIITNHVLGDYEIKINDCVIVKIQNDFCGVTELAMRYAQRLANCDTSIDIALYNSRMSYLIGSESKQEADTIRKVYDKVTSGEPMVVIKKDIMSKGFTFATQNLKQNYIACDVMSTKTSIYNEFLSEIGINNSPEKKERLVTDEVNVNNDAIVNSVFEWYLNLKQAEKEINTKYGLNVEFKFPFMEGLKNDTTEFNESAGYDTDRSGSI